MFMVVMMLTTVNTEHHTEYRPEFLHTAHQTRDEHPSHDISTKNCIQTLHLHYYNAASHVTYLTLIYELTLPLYLGMVLPTMLLKQLDK